MSSSRNRNVWITVVVIVVVGVAAVLAFGLSGGSNSPSDDTNGSNGNGANTTETHPVEVVGDVLPAFDTPENDTAIGLVAPTLNGSTFESTPISIAPGSTGRATMVVFLAHWCPHCNAEIPVLLEWKDSGGVPSELDVVAVSTAVAEDRENYPPSKWIVDKGWPWPVMTDSEFNTAVGAYGVRGFPAFILTDAAGKVLYRADGQKTLAEINAIMAEFFPSA